MKIGATIQARTRSTRLPGKVLSPVLGRPLLAHQIERLKYSRLLDTIVVATTTDPVDDAIAALADELGVGCFRGSEDDVLGRVTSAVSHYAIDIHAEFMADNPAPDILLVDACIGLYLKRSGEYDCVTNTLATSYPPGYEVNVYSAAVLFDAERSVADARLREHAGWNVAARTERYRVLNLEAPPAHRMPELHLEVDTPEDLEFVAWVFEELHGSNPLFGLGEVLALARAKPGMLDRNRLVPRRWREFRRDVGSV